MLPLPKTVIVYPDEDQPDLVNTLVSGLENALSDIRVQVGGPAPDPPYAVIEFIPDDITPYRTADWVHISGAGANGMLAALERDGVVPKLITRTVGDMGLQIGEYALSYWLSDLQKHDLRRARQKACLWDKAASRPERVSGRTALIVGTGGIGSGVASVLGALGVLCMGVSRSGRAHAQFDDIIAWDALPPDLSDIDMCIAVLPLTDETRGSLDHSFFQRFEQALFINAGRGPTVDHDALIKALNDGHLRRAVLDVFNKEPLPIDSQLWSHPKVIVTPHISGLTQPEDTVAAFVAAYKAIESGERPELTVNPDAGY